MESHAFSATQLRNKALLALEDAIQECRYRTPRPSFAVRFALAYLWAYSRSSREPFDELWKCLRAPMTPWNFSAADRALFDIYRVLDIARPEAIAWEMWRGWSEQEKRGKAEDQASS